MGAIQDKAGCIGWVVFALACSGPGNGGFQPGSGGANSMGVAGQGLAASPNSGGASGAGAAFGGDNTAGVSGGTSGSAQNSGGHATTGGFAAGGAGAGGRSGASGNSSTGGTVSRGGYGTRGGRGGIAGALAGSSQGGISGAVGGSPQGGTSSAGVPSVGGGGSCVQDLACTLAAPPTTGDLHQDCVDRVNQFRTQCACLPALARWTEGEACADQMSEYDAMQNTAHAGFEAGICDSGKGGQNECPGYSSNAQVISLCLQQMWSEGPGTQNPCNGQCFEDHGHFINMTSTTMTKIACGFYTTSSGKVWAAQNFSR